MAKSNLKIKYSFLKILTGSDLSSRRLPYMEITSPEAGPRVWLTACIHGDEVTGVAIIHEIFKRLKEKLKRGSVYAFPLINPFGFETASYNLTLSNEEIRENLNRAFPGNEKGTLAERIAHRIFTAITKTKPDLVLDLHNDWTHSVPYLALDYNPGEIKNKTDEEMDRLGRKLGLPMVFDPDEDQGTITYALVEKGIPAITLELGESDVVNEEYVQIGVESIWNVLSELEMVEKKESQTSFPLPEEIKKEEIKKYSTLKYSDLPACSASGIIRFLVKPGELVKKNQPFAKIYNVFGKVQETLTTPDKAIVLGYTNYSAVFPGFRVIAFGIIEKEKLKEGGAEK